MSITDTFNPARDGWIFENWGEAAPFSWDLYRRTYMGINPSHNCVEAPLDCAFYEIFKSCAAGGNCGGMSLLALAIFKYGGWMGYCAPASFYSGVNEPDRQDLHEAINILQARQFSASGIENFLDVVDAGNLNNAEEAYNTISSHLGSGDYCVLSIANDALGDAAHTIIPYRADPNPPGQPAGTKALYVWDPNSPYDDYGASHYNAGLNRVLIRSATDWEYKQRDPATTGTHYRGQPTGWCFAIPMSRVLRKARQPMALDMLGDALVSLFVSGPGTAVSQIEDEDGRRLYKSASDVHQSRGDLEQDPARRLKGIGRWPWYADHGHGAPGELYFMRGPTARRNLKISVTGDAPTIQVVSARGIVELAAGARARGRDTIHLAGLGTANQGIELRSTAAARSFDIRQVRLLNGAKDWRSVRLQGVTPGREGVAVHANADLLAVEVVSHERPQELRAHIERFREATLLERRISELRAGAGQPTRLDTRVRPR